MSTTVSVSCPRCDGGTVFATVTVAAGEAADYFYPGTAPEIVDIIDISDCDVCELPVPAREIEDYEAVLRDLIMNAEFTYDPYDD